jgi:hypothetical protein
VVTTSDFFLVRHDLLQVINGTDPSKFPYLFSLADFSIQLHQLGKKNIYTPYCRAVTNVDKTICPGEWSEAEMRDETIRFQTKWGDFLHNCDLFYNPGLIPDNGLSPAEFKRWMTGTA